MAFPNVAFGEGIVSVLLDGQFIDCIRSALGKELDKGKAVEVKLLHKYGERARITQRNPGAEAWDQVPIGVKVRVAGFKQFRLAVVSGAPLRRSPLVHVGKGV